MTIIYFAMEGEIHHSMVPKNLVQFVKVTETSGRRWTDEYYQLLNAEGTGDYFIPRTWAEHDFGTLPRDTLYLAHRGKGLIVPRVFEQDSGTEDGYRIMWWDIFRLMAPRIILPLNYLLEFEGVSSSKAFKGFVRAVEECHFDSH